jgi:hypothetical protein
MQGLDMLHVQLPPAMSRQISAPILQSHNLGGFSQSDYKAVRRNVAGLGTSPRGRMGGG